MKSLENVNSTEPIVVDVNEPTPIFDSVVKDYEQDKQTSQFVLDSIKSILSDSIIVKKDGLNPVYASFVINEHKKNAVSIVSKHDVDGQGNIIFPPQDLLGRFGITVGADGNLIFPISLPEPHREIDFTDIMPPVYKNKNLSLENPPIEIDKSKYKKIISDDRFEGIKAKRDE